MSEQQYGKRVTLQDIARKTGYTINTVSRALKDKPDIAEPTRRMIQRVANEMGYVRNFMASSLRSGRTKTIGLIIGAMSNPYYAMITDEVHDAAAKIGYSLMTMCTREDPDVELQAVEMAMGRQVDGILLFPGRDAVRSIERMRAADMPYVLMSRHLGRDVDDSVVCAEEEGGYLATKHLIESGRRKLGFMCGHTVVFSTDMRYAGFLRACDEAGIPEADRRYLLTHDPDEMTRTLLQWRDEGVNGLFMFCDMEAWNGINLLQNNGVRIPEDVAIVGYDNIQSRIHFPMPLCTIDSSPAEMIDQAITLLRKRIHRDALPPQHLVVPARLVCRDSCGNSGNKK